jgi:hypothetical protein
LAAAADVEHDRLGALVQAVEMPLQESGMAGPHAQPLPYAVADDEPRIEHRHDRPLARDQVAVDPHEDALVARVVLEVVRAVSHPANPTPPYGFGLCERHLRRLP